MSDQAAFIVLCEDLQSQVFIRKALVERGVEPRKIRWEALPHSAANAYVVKKYPNQVKALRRRKAKASTGLVVHIDADPTHTVSERHKQLADALKEDSLPPRTNDEPIAELVPKRNIETWIYALDPTLLSSLGEPLAEEKAYRKLEYQSDCKSAAKAFAQHSQNGTKPETTALVPSLLDGFREFKRLP